MNYKVLYRKYRPSSFGDVVGQKSVISLIKDSILNDKIAHAYIFSGPRGTGKTSTAKIFAKAINCSSNIEGNPCGKCENCINFSSSSDIYEIDAASNNGVDQIRELIENIKLSPINSKYKVYIIDEVHMLSTNAFNALLLTLEEPPSHAVFILATTNIESIPITVLSRCQRLDFRKIGNHDIENALEEIAQKEKIEIEKEAIKEIALYADGGLRDALSILDQLSKQNEKITQDMVLDTIGIVSKSHIMEVIEYVETGNVDNVELFIANMKERSTDFKSIIQKLISAIKEKAIQTKKGQNSSLMQYEDYKNLCFELANLLYKNNVNIDSYELLELVLLDYVNNNVISHNPKLTPKTREMPIKPEKNKKNEEEEKYFPGNILQELENVRINNCFISATKNHLIDSQKKWTEFISELKNKKIKGMLLDSVIVMASPSIMVIKTDFKEKSDLINSCLKEVEQLLNDKYKDNYKLIATSEENWIEKTNNYKENIKKNVKYEVLPEPSLNNDSDILDDIFAKQKIEIN